MSVDRTALDARLEQILAVMASHAGGVELVDTDARGAVRLRFTGMCAGCRLRPLTLRATIEPALLAVPGVTAVEADGGRISAEAAARLQRYFPHIRPIESIG
jgi:Fe-S cluster biogenesis protein NfuA